MSTVLQSARGASAFTQTNPSLFSPASGGSLVFSRTEEDPTHTWPDLIDELLRILKLKDDWTAKGPRRPTQAW